MSYVSFLSVEIINTTKWPTKRDNFATHLIRAIVKKTVDDLVGIYTKP